jgi:hypothetical protein
MATLDHSTLEGTISSLAQIINEERQAMRLVKEDRLRIVSGLKKCGDFATGLSHALMYADSANTKIIVKAWPELIIKAGRSTEGES